MNACIMVGVAHFAEDLFVIIKSYNLQGMQLALSLQHVSARGFVVAGTLCCVVYMSDARKQPNQWLRENPPACSAGSRFY